MKPRAIFAALAFAVSLPALAATAGQAAPNFTLTDTRGNAVELSDFRGQYVVLEWTNPGCPFVRNHYDTKNMQCLQARPVGREQLRPRRADAGDRGDARPDCGDDAVRLRDQVLNLIVAFPRARSAPGSTDAC